MAELSKTILDSLGRGYAEHCEELSLLFLCVSQAVKPAFMWDYPSVSLHKLQSMLSTLNSKGLITEHVVTVSVDSDVFILNLDTVTRNLVAYLTSTHSWLVDINTAQPKVATTDVHNLYKQFIRSILRQLGITKSDIQSPNSDNPQTRTSEESSHEEDRVPELNPDQSVPDKPQLTLAFPDSANLSTIFGLLLGNPQVYWWNPASNDGSKLSGMALKVYQFNAVCAVLPEDDNALELFSFSVPEALEGTLRPAIRSWGNIAHTRVEQSQCFSAASFNCDQMLCLDVKM